VLCFFIPLLIVHIRPRKTTKEQENRLDNRTANLLFFFLLLLVKDLKTKGKPPHTFALSFSPPDASKAPKTY